MKDLHKDIKDVIFRILKDLHDNAIPISVAANDIINIIEGKKK